MTSETLNRRFHAQTDPGLIRDNNEDAFSINEGIGLAVLADGMGGYNAGEVASSMAATLINEDLSRWMAQAGAAVSLPDLHQALEISVSNANLAVFRASRDNPQYAGMGTTLVVGVFHGNQLVLGHIGDSRCYRWRGNELAQITRDHSLLQEQLDAGLITPEQAAMSLNKNLVTRALGVEDAVALEVHQHDVEAGDTYLMCSDGLSDMVRDADIARVLQSGLPLDQQAKGLVDLANAYGGRDNITVLLVQIESGSDKKGLMARLLGK